jgi:hypothetical protein
MTDLIEALVSMRSGQVAADLNAKFNEVLQAVLDTGKKGKLTIDLFIAPSKFGMGAAVIEIEMSHETKLKVPELEIGRSFFFVNKDGSLTRDDPAQTAMFVDETKQEETAK